MKWVVHSLHMPFAPKDKHYKHFELSKNFRFTPTVLARNWIKIERSGISKMYHLLFFLLLFTIGCKIRRKKQDLFTAFFITINKFKNFLIQYAENSVNTIECLSHRGYLVLSYVSHQNPVR